MFLNTLVWEKIVLLYIVRNKWTKRTKEAINDILMEIGNLQLRTRFTESLHQLYFKMEMIDRNKSVP